MQIVQKLRDFAVKLLNLRICDRRNRRITLILADPGILGMSPSLISTTYDYDTDMIEYNLYTAAGFRVNNPKDAVKIVNPM